MSHESARDVARTVLASVGSHDELLATAASVLDEVVGAGDISSWVVAVLEDAAASLRGLRPSQIDNAMVPFTPEDPESSSRDVMTVRWAIEVTRHAFAGQRELFAEAASGLLAFAMSPSRTEIEAARA